MMTLTVVGGVYREMLMWPTSDEVYGSAGRAACSITQIGGMVHLHGYADDILNESMSGQASGYGFNWNPTKINHGVSFRYTHGLSTPKISCWSTDAPPISIDADRVLRYGMLEGTARITAEWAVYDPQNARNPEAFSANGSRAEHLAIVLNEHEAEMLLGQTLTAKEAVRAIADAEGAEVVVLKRGPRGALVNDASGLHAVPAYDTPQVSKIGSGDQFSAHFAYAWMIEGRSPSDAALRASKATAYYCEKGQFPTAAELDDYDPTPLALGSRWLEGYRARVYLAGPFFSLAQLWMVEEARVHLSTMGLEVISPYHDVGQGEANYVVPLDLAAIVQCDLVFAIADGLDPGTIYEIGYARALGRPVVVYAENETPENLKMMAGSDCFLCPDFVSAIYRAAWIGTAL